VQSFQIGVGTGTNPYEEVLMLLILAIVLLVIAIAGGVIIHPLIFLLALVALALFFSHRGRAVR
jgi:hypothetical protein